MFAAEASPSSLKPSQQHGTDHSDNGASIGGAVGGAVGAILIALVIAFVWFRRKRRSTSVGKSIGEESDNKAELQGRQRCEAGSRPVRRELAGKDSTYAWEMEEQRVPVEMNREARRDNR
jgi:hypothetical protein